jgi:hypothetical protein
MRRLIVLFLIVFMTLPVLCQTPSDKYVAGTVVEVVRHKAEKANPGAPILYDVTLKVGEMVYVILYTPPDGSSIVEYRVGADLPVLVGNKTIKYSDLAGNAREVPILRKRSAKAQN